MILRRRLLRFLPTEASRLNRQAADSLSVEAAVSAAMLSNLQQARLPLQPILFPFVRSPSLTPRDPKLLWRFARFTLFRASQSWPQKENPAHEKRFSAREHNRSRVGARQVAKGERKRLATFTTSVPATRTDQAP
jgi:hypothetical protein